MDSASFQTLPFVKYHLERCYITMLSISWHIRLRKFNPSPHTHTHSHTCRKCYIPNLMQLAHTSDRVHFPDSSSLAMTQTSMFPSPFLPACLPSFLGYLSPPLLLSSEANLLACLFANLHWNVQTESFIFHHWLVFRGACLWGKVLITNMIIKID